MYEYFVLCNAEHVAFLITYQKNVLQFLIIIAHKII